MVIGDLIEGVHVMFVVLLVLATLGVVTFGLALTAYTTCDWIRSWGQEWGRPTTTSNNKKCRDPACWCVKHSGKNEVDRKSW